MQFKPFLTIIILFTSSISYSQSDKLASPETVKLYKELMSRSRDFNHGKIIFGHQNAYTQGRGWSLNYNTDWIGSLPKTDLNKTIGQDPGLIGYDFSEIGNWNENLIISIFQSYHAKGGVITMSWHMPNMNDQGIETNAWDTKNLLAKKIIYDVKIREIFLKKVDRLVNFLQKVPNIPIIFRPFHEHNHSWFWWGNRFTTVKEYKELWNILIHHLQKRGVHHLLYAYSPTGVTNDYLNKYPGDHLVDILGVDNYFLNPVSAPLVSLYHWKKEVLHLMRIAETKNKIPAITEFGNEGIKINNFWSDYVVWPIEKDGMEQFANSENIINAKIKAAYIMLWRNDPSDAIHYYSPFPGHSQNYNFQEVVKKNVLDFLH